MRSAVSTHTDEDSSKMLGRRDTDFSVKGIMGGQNTSSKRHTKVPLANHVDSKGGIVTPATTYSFTKADILQYFFGKAIHSQAENERCLENNKKLRKDKDCVVNNGLNYCGVCQQMPSEHCPMHAPLQSLRKLVNTEEPELKSKEHATYAVASFPPEVQLCPSSIPGHFYGVCARQFIPVGTWIGPYEGVRVAAEDVHEGMDMSYMWEVYQDGSITSYFDGKDETVSSWMRFIRCARHKHEQNLFVFQYGENIYYRAYEDISPGTELLVWYDDQYEKFLGVPVRLRYISPSLVGQVYPQDIDLTAFTKTPNYSRLPPNQPLHCDTQFPGINLPNSYVHSKSPANECNDVLTEASGITKESAETKDANCGRTSPRDSSGNLEPGVWRCGQCFKSFTQRSLLQVHVCPRLPEKPYQCGHCAQSFAHPTDLRTHVVTHNSERPFKCGFCGRSFAGSTTLNNHIRTHTGQKPFVCEKCSRSFSQASQLSRHQRLPGDCCHRDTGY